MQAFRFIQKLPLFTSILVILSAPYLAAAASNDWTSLFNGKNLDGWQVLNGDAKYHIEDDAIVGTAKLNTPNTFLATEKTYGDFILEFDVKVDHNLNTGVQIRSLSKESYRDGRVHGYQVEIDPGPRAYSGGIYDEARRAWLYPPSRNPDARAAFRGGEWNHFRVEAIGASIRTWINGVQVVDLVDDMTAKGFIALQVHSIGEQALVGTQVRWRNLRIQTKNLAASRKTADPKVEQISFLDNRLTEVEKRRGWRMLWDGKSSKGWKRAKSAGFPSAGWKMKGGIMTLQGKGDTQSDKAGDIITVDKFGDFELSLEFNMTEGANSGIKYFVRTDFDGAAIGNEFQILDDKNHPDAKQGIMGTRTLGALYDLIPASNISFAGRSKQFKGLDNWNQARIVSRKGIVEHWLNNEKVLEYDRHSQTFQALVAYSKYKDFPGFGQWPEGHILLQDHGHVVHFKNIKIREF